MDRYETFRDCSATIPLSSLKDSYLYTIPCGFYDSSNEQNWMCELCTFSQIRSHRCLCPQKFPRQETDALLVMEPDQSSSENNADPISSTDESMGLWLQLIQMPLLCCWPQEKE